MLELTTCLKKKASYYGKIYVGAWQNAKSEVRTLLEKMCFKHIMEAFLKDHRTSIELTKLGQNLLSVLDVWHSERKKKNADFITMITDCYQSFIWKYLKVFLCLMHGILLYGNLKEMKMNFFNLYFIISEWF